MRQTAPSSPAGLVLLYGACAVLLAAGMQAAATLVNSLILAVVLATVLAPILRRLLAAGLPGWLAGLVVLTPVLIIGALFVGFLVQSVSELIATIPDYAARLTGFLALVSQRFFGDPETLRRSLPSMAPEPSQIVALTTTALASALQSTNDFLLVVFLLIYACIEAVRLPVRLHALVGPTSAVPRRLHSLANELRTFVVINGQAGVLVSVVRTGLLMVLGVDFAMLWGAWSLLLTYVPTVGYPLAVIPPTLVALVDQGPETALIVFVVYGILNTVVYNVLQPKWAGASLNVSPFVVIVSLFFWGIVLGAMGALLAVPLTMIVIALLESSEHTRWIAALMRDQTAPPATAAYKAAGGGADPRKG